MYTHVIYVPALSDNERFDIHVCTKFIVMLYADEAVVMAGNANDLQNSLNNSAEYCKTWKLKINVNKIKMLILGSRGRANTHFNIDGKIIEIVESYKYLGIILKQ